MSKAEKLTYQNFIPLLFKEIPEFKESVPEYSEETRELKHSILLGDLTQFLIEQFYQFNLTKKQSQLHYQRIRKVLDFLEKGMNSRDPKIHELISVYFLENLLGEQYYDQIESMLGSKLKEELQTWN